MVKEKEEKPVEDEEEPEEEDREGKDDDEDGSLMETKSGGFDDQKRTR